MLSAPESKAHADLERFRLEVEQFRTEVEQIRWEAEKQQEVASLQDVHQSKMAALKKRHKDEITQLKSQISSFEQQLNDGTCILNIL